MSTCKSVITGMRIITRTFSPRDLVGGHPALDLVNTVTARNTPNPVDWLDGYPRLLEWARLANVTDETRMHTLRKQAIRHAADAALALEQIKQLREALHVIYVAMVSDERAPAAALEQLETAWKDAQSGLRLSQVEDRIETLLDADYSGLDWIRHSIALSAVELLRTLPHGRARICEGEHCGWLFVDTSKGGQRLWCDMATCGNAAKTRRQLSKRRSNLKRRKKNVPK
jgi:predicted RNA-binding Zn ribbon-like protein